MNTNTVSMTVPDAETLPLFGEPTNPAAVADALVTATHEGKVVVPIGGAGALQLGNPVRGEAVALSTRGLTSIRSYEPTDMTLSVSAGTTVAEIRSVLGAHGQLLPVEAPVPDRATIGGLLATALTGPRRYGGGTLRDVLIGIEVAYCDGSVAKAGGLVVKNVSGFDMMRLHYGALGTLGVITGANFKVLAQPRHEFTWFVTSTLLGDAARIAARLRPLPDRPVALVINEAGGQTTLAARFEGRRSGLDAIGGRLARLDAQAHRIDDAESTAYWQQVMDERAFAGDGSIVLAVQTSPAAWLESSERIAAQVAAAGVAPTRLAIEPGLGLIRLVLPGDRLDAAWFGTLLKSLRAKFETRVLCAPALLRAGIDVWGRTPDTISLMRRLKAEFDPAGTLNPGRFVDFI